MKFKLQRLFSIRIAEVSDEIAMPDPVLRSKTDSATGALIDLMSAAELSGLINLNHGFGEGFWLLHVDADSKIHDQFQLFEKVSNKPVAAALASRRLVAAAMAELARLVASKQAVDLGALIGAGRAVHASGKHRKSHLVELILKSPDRKLQLETRAGPLTLSYNGDVGRTLSQDKALLLCRVWRVGSNHAVIRPLPKSVKALPWPIGRNPRLEIPPRILQDGFILKLVEQVMLPNAQIEVVVRRVERKSTGTFAALFLEEAPVLGEAGSN